MSLTFMALALHLVVLAWTGQARAEADQYSLETAGLGSREEADALRERAAAEGLQIELVRSFKKGRGWVYVLRVAGIDDRDEARAQAERLAQLCGQPVQGYLLAGRELLPVEALSVPAPGARAAAEPSAVAALAVPAEPPTPDAEQLARGAALLSAVILAHGGGAAGLPGEQASGGRWSKAHFRFERWTETPAGAVNAWHDYWRDGRAVRLEVRILDGAGKSSTALVQGDGAAWLLVEEALSEVDPGPTREALLSFAPEAVLEQALAFRAWPAENPAVLLGAGDGGDLQWLAFEQPDATGQARLGVDPGDHRVRELILSDTTRSLRWRFGDYRELAPGLIVPLRQEILEGAELRERVTVRLLELGVSPDAALMEPASLKTVQQH